MSEDALRVDRRLDGAAVVLRASGEIDMNTAPLLAEELEQAISTNPELIVVDLSDVTFFGSAGIAALLNAREQHTETGGRLRLVATHGPVLRSLEIAGVLELLPIYPSIPEASA
ncbi:anti-anti-sigma factor [Kibdelosporangium banguiense]|uniref:Anti-sigma factor antagonist n=1 Tax=Kibdelosporangium banguiense TaxID=1365924 RepID=A0ABS4TMX1_9PSEU|nr:STAS domain-containing protein [Kibdelosporangium banguiense]MBP2325761.1 anti-anti-sigma factor [Kibdelosporangium banguiense]